MTITSVRASFGSSTSSQWEIVVALLNRLPFGDSPKIAISPNIAPRRAIRFLPPMPVSITWPKRTWYEIHQHEHQHNAQTRLSICDFILTM